MKNVSRKSLEKQTSWKP